MLSYFNLYTKFKIKSKINIYLLILSILFFIIFFIFTIIFNELNLINNFYSNGFWVFAPDAKMYHNSALSISELYKHNIISFREFIFVDRNHANVKWIALFYMIFNTNEPIYFQFFNLILWIFSIIFVFKTSNNIFNNNLAAICACLFFFLPSIFFNYLSTMRDPFFILGVSLFFYSLSRINYEKLQFSIFLFLTFSLYLIDEIRSYIIVFFYILLLTIPIYYLILKKIKIFYFTKLLSLSLGVVIISISLTYYLNTTSDKKFLYNLYQYECFLRNMSNYKQVVSDDYNENLKIRNFYADSCRSGIVDEKSFFLEVTNLNYTLELYDKNKNSDLLNVLSNTVPTDSTKKNKNETNKNSDLLNVGSNTVTIDSTSKKILKSRINYAKSPAAVKRAENENRFHNQLTGAADAITSSSLIIKKINDIRRGFIVDGNYQDYSSYGQLFKDMPNIIYYGFFSPSIFEISVNKSYNFFNYFLIFETSIHSLIFLISLFFLLNTRSYNLAHYLIIFSICMILTLALFIPSQYSFIRLKSAFLVPFYLASTQLLIRKFKL